MSFIRSGDDSSPVKFGFFQHVKDSGDAGQDQGSFFFMGGLNSNSDDDTHKTSLAMFGGDGISCDEGSSSDDSGQSPMKPSSSEMYGGTSASNRMFGTPTGTVVHGGTPTGSGIHGSGISHLGQLESTSVKVALFSPAKAASAGLGGVAGISDQQGTSPCTSPGTGQEKLSKDHAGCGDVARETMEKSCTTFLGKDKTTEQVFCSGSAGLETNYAWGDGKRMKENSSDEIHISETSSVQGVDRTVTTAAEKTFQFKSAERRKPLSQAWKPDDKQESNQAAASVDGEGFRWFSGSPREGDMVPSLTSPGYTSPASVSGSATNPRIIFSPLPRADSTEALRGHPERKRPALRDAENFVVPGSPDIPKKSPHYVAKDGETPAKSRNSVESTPDHEYSPQLSHPQTTLTAQHDWSKSEDQLRSSSPNLRDIRGPGDWAVARFDAGDRDEGYKSGSSAEGTPGGLDDVRLGDTGGSLPLREEPMMCSNQDMSLLWNSRSEFGPVTRSVESASPSHDLNISDKARSSLDSSGLCKSRPMPTDGDKMYMPGLSSQVDPCGSKAGKGLGDFVSGQSQHGGTNIGGNVSVQNDQPMNKLLHGLMDDFASVMLRSNLENFVATEEFEMSLCERLDEILTVATDYKTRLVSEKHFYEQRTRLLLHTLLPYLSPSPQTHTPHTAAAATHM